MEEFCGWKGEPAWCQACFLLLFLSGKVEDGKQLLTLLLLTALKSVVSREKRRGFILFKAVFCLLRLPRAYSPLLLAQGSDLTWEGAAPCQTLHCATVLNAPWLVPNSYFLP